MWFIPWKNQWSKHCRPSKVSYQWPEIFLTLGTFKALKNRFLTFYYIRFRPPTKKGLCVWIVALQNDINPLCCALFYGNPLVMLAIFRRKKTHLCPLGPWPQPTAKSFIRKRPNDRPRTKTTKRPTSPSPRLPNRTKKRLT